MGAPISLESVVVAVPDQVSSDVGGEAVVLGLDRGVYYGLNAVAARIWQLIQEPRRLSDVAAVILEEYEIDRARCERDLLALVHQLIAEGLVEVVNGETATVSQPAR